MKTINVEKYESSTFRRWTDGPKYVFDLKGLSIDFKSDPGNLQYYVACTSVSLVQKALKDHTSGVGTFFMICSINEFLEIVDVRPDLDVRLLVV